MTDFIAMLIFLFGLVVVVAAVAVAAIMASDDWGEE